MNRVLAYLGRFAAMIFGFIAAMFVASITINLLLLAAMETPLHGPSEIMIAATVANIAVVAALGGYAAFFPALLAMLVAELAGLRDWLFHVISGGAVAFLVMAAHWVLADTTQAEPDFMLAAIVVAAGLTGGMAYWVVAGRGAGVMMDRQAAASGSGPSRS